nr:GNAT family N-acetyltransferase [Planococcus lenghuensis]
MEQEGVIAGCIGIELTENMRGQIRHIAVSPKMRGRQMGRNMITEIHRLHGLLQLHAETDCDAAGFYRRCGFNISSLGEKYPGVERFLCVKRWEVRIAPSSPVT